MAVSLFGPLNDLPNLMHVNKINLIFATFDKSPQNNANHTPCQISDFGMTQKFSNMQISSPLTIFAPKCYILTFSVNLCKHAGKMQLYQKFTVTFCASIRRQSLNGDANLCKFLQFFGNTFFFWLLVFL